MKKIGLIFLVVLILAFSIAYAKDFKVEKKAGEYSVKIEIDKNPPTVGKNNMKIEVKDSTGKHVTDAAVKVNYSMPAMPGMPPMSYKTDAQISGNEYKAVMNLSMSGPWNIEIKINRGGKTTTVKFNIDVR
jgi:hypothetical protein